MTCRLKVVVPVGTLTQARAFVNSATSTILTQSGSLKGCDHRIAVATPKSMELQVLMCTWKVSSTSK